LAGGQRTHVPRLAYCSPTCQAWARVSHRVQGPMDLPNVCACPLPSTTRAAGGTGQFAVQLAALAGHHVIATCSSEAKAQLLRQEAGQGGRAGQGRGAGQNSGAGFLHAPPCADSAVQAAGCGARGGLQARVPEGGAQAGVRRRGGPGVREWRQLLGSWSLKGPRGQQLLGRAGHGRCCPCRWRCASCCSVVEPGRRAAGCRNPWAATCLRRAWVRWRRVGS
jgi:hypothetical protein